MWCSEARHLTSMLSKVICLCKCGNISAKRHFGKTCGTHLQIWNVNWWWAPLKNLSNERVFAAMQRIKLASAFDQKAIQKLQGDTLDLPPRLDCDDVIVAGKMKVGPATVLAVTAKVVIVNLLLLDVCSCILLIAKESSSRNQ